MTGFMADFPDETLMDSLGDDVTYISNSESPKLIKATVDHDVERIGDDGYTVEKRTEVEFLLNAINNYPERGDFIIVDLDSFKVDGIISDDGKYVRLAMKK